MENKIGHNEVNKTVTKAKPKKKVKSSKKLVLMVIGALLIFTAVLLIWYFVRERNKRFEGEETNVKIEASAGQEIVFAQLTSVKGNEITYTVAKEAEEGGFGQMQQMPSMPEGGEMQQMPSMPEGGEMQQMPSMPEGGEMQQMPGGQGEGGFGDGQKGGRDGNPGNRGDQGNQGDNQREMQSTYAFSYDGINYRLTEESRTEMIPVGTEVITKLGTVTTFSRLAAGDNVALVIENEGDEHVIVAVYIIG